MLNSEKRKFYTGTLLQKYSKGYHLSELETHYTYNKGTFPQIIK